MLIHSGKCPHPLIQEHLLGAYSPPGAVQRKYFGTDFPREADRGTRDRRYCLCFADWNIHPNTKQWSNWPLVNGQERQIGTGKGDMRNKPEIEADALHSLLHKYM